MLRRLQNTQMIPIAMLGLWCLVFWNNFSNKHVHLTENGHLIVHAHPFQKGETEHEHTDEEYIFWDIISNAQFHTFTPPVIIPESLPQAIVTSKVLPTRISFNSLDKNPDNLRGPPFFS